MIISNGVAVETAGYIQDKLVCRFSRGGFMVEVQCHRLALHGQTKAFAADPHNYAKSKGLKLQQADDSGAAN